MSRTPRSIVVALIVVGQLGVVAAATDGGTATVERPDGRVPVSHIDPATHPATFEDPPRLRAAAVEIASAIESVSDVAPGILIPPVGYSRYDGSDPLENGVRRTIYETVVGSPGTYITEIATETDVPESTVRYHVRVLDDEELLRMEKIHGKRWVFPTHVEDVEIEAALNGDSTATVLEAVGRMEPSSVSAIARSLDRTPSTVSYHLSRLEESGLVTRERDGGSVSVSLTAATRTRMEGNTGTG